MSRLTAYHRLFHGRRDVFARRWRNRQTGRCGYAPVLRPESWRDGRPPARSTPDDYLPFTSSELVERHLSGHEHLAIYPILPDGTTRLLVFDFDGDTSFAEAAEVQAVCGVQEIPAYLEVSRSGNHHVWVFFDQPIEAWLARRFGTAALAEAGIAGASENTAFDRMIPHQDEVPDGGLGNLIALPLQGEAIMQGRTEFLDADNGFRSYQNQWAFLQTVQTVSRPQILAAPLLEGVDMEPPPERPSAGGAPRRMSAVALAIQDALRPQQTVLEAELERVERGCRFVEFCRDEARTLPEPAWWSLGTILAAFGEQGRQRFHEYSRPYPVYSSAETNAKFDSVAGRPPHRCKYIRECVWNCGRDCGVTSPAALRHTGSDSQGDARCTGSRKT